MTNLAYVQNPALAWHELYHAALLEADRSKVPDRINEAEKATLARIRELFAISTDHIEERPDLG